MQARQVPLKTKNVKTSKLNHPVGTTQHEQVAPGSAPRGASKTDPTTPSCKAGPEGSTAGDPSQGADNKALTAQTPYQSFAWAPELNRKQLDQLWGAGGKGRRLLQDLDQALDQLARTVIIGTRVLVGAKDHGQEDAMRILPLETKLNQLAMLLRDQKTTEAPDFLKGVSGCKNGLEMAKFILMRHAVFPNYSTLEEFAYARQTVAYSTWYLRGCFRRRFEICEHLFEASDAMQHEQAPVG